MSDPSSSNHPDPQTSGEILSSLDARQLKDALAQVRSGDLSPYDAAKQLLTEDGEECSQSNVDSSPTTESNSCSVWVEPTSQQGETLASLLDRLGSPPKHLVDRWCDQLAIACAIHQHEHGDVFTDVDTEQWRVDSSGNLNWSGYTFHHSGNDSSKSYLREDAAELLKAFCGKLGHSQSRRDQSATALNDSSVDADKIQPVSVIQEDTTKVVRDRKRSTGASAAKRKPNGSQYFITAASVAALVGLGAILYIASRPKTDSVAKTDSRPKTDSIAETSGVKQPSVIHKADRSPIGVSTDPVHDETESTDSTGIASPASEKLMTFDQGSESPTEDALPDEAIDFSTSLSDSMIPDLMATTESHGDVPSESTKSAQTEFGKGDSPDFGDGSTEPPHDQPQETRVTKEATERSISLPQTSDLESLAEIGVFQKEVQLEFPTDTKLEIADGTSIRDPRSKNVVATIQTGDADSPREFRWTELAKKTSSSVLLLHGRVRDSFGNTVYLRPEIEAAGWPIKLDDADVQPSWDLKGNISPRVTRVQVDCSLPDDVELGWIESLEPDDIRKGLAVAVLTPKDGESVSLGMRLDVRCNRKLMIRVRFAAKLHSKGQWQIVSRPLLADWQQRLTQQQTMVSNQLIQIESLYSKSGSDGRRMLRGQRDQLEENKKTLSQSIEVSTELEKLIALVENGARLNPKVWVEWPDGSQQVLMACKTPAGDGN